MVQNQSVLVPSDNSGVWLVRTIHTYSNLSRIMSVNNFGKVSVISASASSWLRNNNNRKFLYTSSSISVSSSCGCSVMSYNSNLLLNKRLTPIGRRVVGYISKDVTRNRAIASFIKIL